MKLVAVSCVALVTALASVVAAQPCAEEAVMLRGHLDVEARRASRWNTAWAIGFGGASAVQLALAVTGTKPFGTFDRDFEETMYVGAAKAAVGFGVRVVLPLRVKVPAASADACADVVALRAAVADAGRRERRVFWLTHLGGLSLNLAGAALLTSRRSFRVGATSFAISFPVGPASAYTQPRRSWQLWRERRASWSIGVTAGADSTTLWLGVQ